MPLPPDFNQQEHLQSVIRKWMNREVLDYFTDLGLDEADDDLTTPRGSLRTACRHLDTDSLIMTHLRWELFERIRLQRTQVPYYGIPVDGYHISRKFKPQITLYFQEDAQDVEPGFAPVSGQLTFRLMDYTESTINPAIASTYAQRIETNFGQGGGYLWRKGRIMCSYTDNERGYKLQILARDDTYARDLINRVLDIQNHTPDWSRLNVSENQNAAAAYPPIPENDLIYGQSRRRPRRRPVADVRFQVSFLNVHGLTTPQVLFDRTSLYPSALAT